MSYKEFDAKQFMQDLDEGRFPNDFWNKLSEYGKVSGSEGTRVVEKRLDDMIELIKFGNGDLGGEHASEYLLQASRAIWQKGKNLEPILYLYNKFEGVNPESNGKDWPSWPGEEFTTLMVEIAADVEKDDRKFVVESTISIIRRNIPIVDIQVREMTWLAGGLSEKGLEEGISLAEFLYESPHRDTFLGYVGDGGYSPERMGLQDYI